MEKIAMEIISALREPGTGLHVITMAAIIVAGMSVYGMIVALRKK